MDDLERQAELLERAMEDLRTQGMLTADTFEQINKEGKGVGGKLDELEKAFEEFKQSWKGKVLKSTTMVVDGFISTGQAARENRESFESLNPIINSVGEAMKAIPIAGEAMGETFKTIGTFVTKELQQSVVAYQELGNVGAISARGISGLRTDAERAGLSFAQLSNTVSKNGQALAFAFGSTADGATELSNLTEAATPFRRELLALGFGIQEQSEVFADYAKIQAQLGRQQTGDYRQQAARANEYARTLDELTRITGLSRDAAQELYDEQMRNVRFRSALQGLPDETADNIRQVSAVLQAQSPELAKGFQDLVAGFGTEASADLAVATKGAAPLIMEALKNGLPPEQALLQLKDNVSGMINSIDPAVLGTGTVIDRFALSARNLADNAAISEEAFRRVSAAQLAAAGAEDEQTKEMVDAQLALQKFAQEMDAFVNANIFPSAVKVMEKFTNALADLGGQINEFTGVRPSGPRAPATQYDPSDIDLENQLAFMAAEGAQVKAGDVGLVGEEGPEIFIPKTDGTILPNGVQPFTNEQLMKELFTATDPIEDLVNNTSLALSQIEEVLEASKDKRFGIATSVNKVTGLIETNYERGMKMLNQKKQELAEFEANQYKDTYAVRPDLIPEHKTLSESMARDKASIMSNIPLQLMDPSEKGKIPLTAEQVQGLLDSLEEKIGDLLPIGDGSFVGKAFLPGVGTATRYKSGAGIDAMKLEGFGGEALAEYTKFKRIVTSASDKDYQGDGWSGSETSLAAKIGGETYMKQYQKVFLDDGGSATISGGFTPTGPRNVYSSALEGVSLPAGELKAVLQDKDFNKTDLDTKNQQIIDLLVQLNANMQEQVASSNASLEINKKQLRASTN